MEWYFIVLIALAFLLFIFALSITVSTCVTHKAYSLPVHMTAAEHKRLHAEKRLDESYRDLERVGAKFRMPDGYILNGDYIFVPGSEKFIIMSHGFCSSRERIMRQAALFHELGFSVLVYDLRGLGDNEVYPVSLGVDSSRDLAVLVETVKREFSPSVLGLFGASMGSTTSLLSTKYTDGIDFIISDCGYITAEGILTHILRKNHVPFVRPTMKVIDIVNRKKYHYSLSEVDAGAAVAASDVPVLFLNGDRDEFVPYTDAERLFELSCAKIKDVRIFHGAAHCASILQYDEYRDTVSAFLGRVGCA